jgi:hypothetical protein
MVPAGRGIHVDSVSLDGVEIPHLVLELFVEKFLTPSTRKSGWIPFALPSNRIDIATVGLHKLTLTQK